MSRTTSDTPWSRSVAVGAALFGLALLGLGCERSEPSQPGFGRLRIVDKDPFELTPTELAPMQCGRSGAPTILEVNGGGVALFDADGDGLTNVSEYLAGTDPGDAASALRLTAVNLANSKMSLVFEASQGRLIEIQSTPALGQAAWKSVLEVDVKSDGPQQVEVDLPAGEAQFFRLLLVE